MESNRIITVVEDLEKVVLEFMRKHRITHEEYRIATNLIINSIKAGEESLLFDVFFEAESTDIGNVGREGSPEAIEGPFYFAGAPELSEPHALPQRDEEPGELLIFKGRVDDTNGRPIAGAEIDIWQADANGQYSQIHPGLPEWNLRGKLKTDAEGRYEVRTIVPPPYEIPKAGPTGRLLNALGRHFFRPAHLHLKVRHPGHREITSQLYFDGDEYLGSDVASAVRDGLVTKLVLRDSLAAMHAAGTMKPYFEVSYDFTLAPQ